MLQEPAYLRVDRMGEVGVARSDSGAMRTLETSFETGKVERKWCPAAAWTTTTTTTTDNADDVVVRNAGNSVSKAESTV